MVDEQDVDNWIELYQEGLTQEEIAERYNVSPITVSRRLRAKGVKTRGGGATTPNPEKIVEEWIELYEQGKTMKQIADEYGVAQSTISSRLKKKGIKTRGRSKNIPEKVISEWVDLYEGGKTQKQIAKKYDVSQSTVSSRLREKGVTTSWGGYIPEEKVEKWIELYEKGMSKKEIARNAM